MVNHTAGILSPSEATSMPTVPSGMPLQNGPVSLLSPMSKQHQMSGLLPVTSPLKPPSDQQLPNSTVSLSQSSTSSSFLEETVFTGKYALCLCVALCVCGEKGMSLGVMDKSVVVELSECHNLLLEPKVLALILECTVYTIPQYFWMIKVLE